MKLARRQHGVTITSLILVSAVFIFAALVVFKLFPFVNESFQVKAAMESVSNQPPSSRKTSAAVLKLLKRALDVSAVNTFTDANIGKHAKVKKIKGSKDKILKVVYEKRGKFFWKFDIILKFDEQVLLSAPASPDS
jgi:hypothetical protein